MDLSALPTAGELASLGARAPHWRPGLVGARHSEIFASSREAGGAAAALALALDGLRAADPESMSRGQVLWVQDAAAVRLSGRPYRPGLPEALRGKLIYVAAKTPDDALFALEEGVRCRDLAFVVGEIAGNPRALDFVASRRLSLMAEKHGVALWLIRLDAARDLSSARMRWEVRSSPSPRRVEPDEPQRHAMFLGHEAEAARSHEVERAGIAGDLTENESEVAAAHAFLERKKCVLGRLRGDMDYPAAQRFGQSGPIGPSAQPDGCGILDPQHAAFVRQPRTHPVERQRERRCRTPGFPARSEDFAVTRELSALGEPRSPARDASAERGQLAGCGQVRKVHPESTPMFYLCSNLPFMAICRARLSLHRAEPEHVPPAPVAPARRNR